MAMIRKIALGLLLVAAVIAVVVAATQLSHYRPYDYPPVHAASDLDERARIFEDRVEILSRRVGDMELLVLVLLLTSGLYAIVFVASSYFSAKSFARQADRTVNHIKDEIGVAMGDLRELQEQTEGGLGGSNMGLAAGGDRASVKDEVAAAVTIPEAWELQVAGM